MNDSNGKRLNPLVPVIVVIATVAGLWFGLQVAQQREPALPPATAVSVLPQGRPLPDFLLTDHHGKPIGRANLENRWSLLFMGFTHCGHVCPMTMAKMRMIRDDIGDDLRVVFLSVDPGRDTPEVVHDYIRSYHADFVGMTGDTEEIDRLAAVLGAPYFVDADAERYVVDHSSVVFLINPAAEFAGVISAPLDIDAVVAELRPLM
jgi:protein SCO1/2